MTQESIKWLKDNSDIWVRQNRGDHKHLNYREQDAISRIAKEIDPRKIFDHTPNCEKCIREKIEFVFTEFEKPKDEGVMRQSFPKVEKKDKIK